MMIQEFIDRTNYTPSPDEYYHIEKAYYDFDGNKDDFCKWWKKAKRGGYITSVKLCDVKHIYEGA